jgi:hypothetical protein
MELCQDQGPFGASFTPLRGGVRFLAIPIASGPPSLRSGILRPEGRASTEGESGSGLFWSLPPYLSCEDYFNGCYWGRTYPLSDAVDKVKQPFPWTPPRVDDESGGCHVAW